jgi:chaperonin cofactor prefoldin
MKKMQTAKEVLQHIKNMEDDAERYKVVKEIGDFVCGPKAELLTDLLVEYSKVKQDIEYLSEKIGLHDMYFNRLKKEIKKSQH